MRFVIATLATWRVSHLLSAEDGPLDLVVTVRGRLGTGQLAELMDCFYCLSVWTAAPMSAIVAVRPRYRVPVWLAVSGGACMLERATQDQDPQWPADREPILTEQQLRVREHAL